MISFHKVASLIGKYFQLTQMKKLEKIWFWARSDFFAFCRTFPQMAMLDPKSVLSFDASCDPKLVGLVLRLRLYG